MRAHLTDDDVCSPDAPPRRVTSSLDGEPTAEVEINPTLDVRQRMHVGYDDDGNAVFQWSTIVSDVAILWQQRTERDDLASRTLIRAMATVAYDGDVTVNETAVVAVSGFGTFQVQSLAQFPGRIEFELERVTDGG